MAAEISGRLSEKIETLNKRSGAQLHSFFFYKNLFYKNVEAKIDPDFKNILRT